MLFITLLLWLTVTDACAQSDYFGGAQWIGVGSGHVSCQDSAVTMRRSFTPYQKVRHAELRVSTAADYTLCINRRRVGQRVAPSYCGGDRVAFFDVYDVTGYMTAVDNEFSVSFLPSLSPLLFMLYVTYADDSRERLLSDGRWQYSTDGTTWRAVSTVQGPSVVQRLEREGRFECGSERLNALYRQAADSVDCCLPRLETLLYNYEARPLLHQVMEEKVRGTDAADADIIMLPMRYWQHYGSLELARRYYPAMSKCLEQFVARDSGFIIDDDLLATAQYYQLTCYLYLLARQLGHKEDASLLNMRAEHIRQAFNGRFYDPRRKTYGTGGLCELALPLYLQLTPADDQQAVLAKLVEVAGGDSGRHSEDDACQYYVAEVLIRNGQRELAYSRGDVAHKLIPDLLGIVRTGELVEVEPHPVSGVAWCRGQVMSQHGLVSVDWRIEAGMFLLDVDVPLGGFVNVYLPFGGRAESVREGSHHFEVRVE